MSRRPAHKIAHAQCPYGQFNWSDCDAAAAHRWGRCKAEVERKGASEPGECTNWAIGEEGWCGQHYTSRREKELRAAREAERKLQLDAAIDAFIEKASDPGYEWWKNLRTSAESTRGLSGVPVTGVRQAFPKDGVAPPPVPRHDALPRPRRLPHPIRTGKLPHRLAE